MIKICHITNAYQDSIPRILREASVAVKSGFKPYIIAQGNNVEKDGITYIGVKYARNRYHRMICTNFLMYKKAKEIDADIYQIHAPEFLPFATLLKKKGKIVIFDSHEFYGMQIMLKKYIPKIIRTQIAKVYMWYESCICRKLDAVISVCTVNNEDYFKNRAKRTAIIGNYPDLNVFNKSVIENKKEPGSVIYTGLLNYERGITHLIKAIEKTPAKLILCGRFSSKEYYDEIKRLPGFNKVDYKGIVSTNEIAKLVSSCTIGISTLLYKGQYDKVDTLATKVYEYMILGLPVIVSCTPYAKRLTTEYKFGICVNPENIDEIAEKIIFLLNNPEIAKEMGQYGMKVVKEKFNWDSEGKKLIDLYEELINILR